MCSCLKNFVMPPYLTELANPEWGPIFWKLLHVLSTRIGGADEVTDADAANAIYYVINTLYDVLPCPECQTHTRAYLAENKFNPRPLRGAALRTYVEQWLLDFHNSVRARTGKPIEVTTVAEYHALWAPQKFQKCDNDKLTLFFNYGKTHLVIKVPNFHRWNDQLKRLRLLVGA